MAVNIEFQGTLISNFLAHPFFRLLLFKVSEKTAKSEKNVVSFIKRYQQIHSFD
jgi:hypothetical protein